MRVERRNEMQLADTRPVTLARRVSAMRLVEKAYLHNGEY